MRLIIWWSEKHNIIQWLASNTCVLALLLHRGSLAEPGHLTSHEMQLMEPGLEAHRTIDCEKLTGVLTAPTPTAGVGSPT